VKQILKKRTAFETALVRRIAFKSDYLQYLAYEIQLESLRQKRVKRLSERVLLSGQNR
jgi:U3 small nucleolar RNA-associated protein 6